MMDKGVPNMTEDERMRQIASIGDSMAKMRLMVGRRYIGRLAVARVGAGMELSHLDTLVLVRRLSETQEVTIGAIAAQMRIDHSRASRIVAELVQRGQLHRDASQQDKAHDRHADGLRIGNSFENARRQARIADSRAV